MSLGVGSLGSSSSSVNSQIEHRETEQMGSNPVSNQGSSQEISSLFQTNVYEQNQVMCDREIVGVDRDWIKYHSIDLSQRTVRLIFESGTEFQGFFCNGEFKGASRITFPDKSWIETDFQSELDEIFKHRITVGYSNGDVFQGTIDDEMVGYGKMVFSNQNWIEGKFYGRNSVGQAQGAMTLENGSRFIGTLFNGKPRGTGMIIYRDKGWLQGEFDESGLIFTDPVKIRLDNGDRFEGFISSMDKIEGKGKLTFANGDWIEGLFDEMNHIGEGFGEVTLREGVKFRGPFENGRPFGRGTIFFENRISNEMKISSIEGEFDARTGLVLPSDVTINYINGNQFKGVVSLDWMQGRGLLYFASGNWIEGEFLDGGKRIKIEKWRLTNQDGNPWEGSRFDMPFVHGGSDEIIDSNDLDAEIEESPLRFLEEEEMFDTSGYIGRDWDLEPDENPFSTGSDLDIHLYSSL